MFLKAIEITRRSYEGDDVIEGEARRLGNGADGAGDA